MSAPDLSIYFAPLEKSKLSDVKFHEESIGEVISAHFGDFPDWAACQLAVIGVEEDRLSRHNRGSADGPDEVRKYLYKLFPPVRSGFKVCDLGNIKAGDRVEDTHFALKSVVSALVRRSIIPIIIGGSHDLTYANFAAYEKLEQTINVLTIDRIFDLSREQDEFHAEAFLNRIILHDPNYLFNFSNIGYQTYFLSSVELELMEKLFFDTYRLGVFKNNMAATEPVIRNADLVSFDVSAIRQSDAPGSAHAGPNGFYGEEACQMCRYAGMSDKLSSFGIYEYNPGFDRQGQTAHLVAQMIWCFIDGYYQRKGDFPFRDETRYFKYQVVLKDFEHELLFYKSKLSDRWWLSVPYPPAKKFKFERHHLVPCSYEDYQLACSDEVPDLWWKTFQKLS